MYMLENKEDQKWLWKFYKWMDTNI